MQGLSFWLTFPLLSLSFPSSVLFLPPPLCSLNFLPLPLCPPLPSSHHRYRKDNNLLPDLLGPVVQEVMANEEMQLHTSPVDVYKAWINKMESETGEAT